MGERTADFEDSSGHQVAVTASDAFALVKIESHWGTLIMDQYEFEKLAKFVMGIK